VVEGGGGEAHLVFTRRPETMPSHRGEVAFPGGKLDPLLDATARDAALREAEEEIGLPRARVDVVAELETLPTYVGPFLISPFVGIVDEPVTLVPHPLEVARVFDVAVSELLADGVHHAETWDFLGGTRTMHFFELDDETIWGATARILAGFLAHLTGVALPA
jgi:8-oxo-dGTP pyrophosphatase MutT (NUDIX family)